MQDRKKEDQKESGWKLKDHKTPVYPTHESYRSFNYVEKKHESIKSLDEHFTQTRQFVTFALVQVHNHCSKFSPLFSGPAFSSPSKWSSVFRSCIFWSLFFPKYWSCKFRSCFFQSSIFSAPAHVKAVLAAKLPSHNRSPKWRFFEKFEDLNIKYSHRGPLKGTFLPGTTSSGVFCVKIRSKFGL